MSLRRIITLIATFGLFAMFSPNTWGQAQQAAQPLLGEYAMTPVDTCDPVDAIPCRFCVEFTKNLNEFREIDFETCHPRLSEKFPEFTRPDWEELPFDLEVAETIVKNLSSRTPESQESFWQAWLTASAPLRAQGTLKLWRTRIDLDGDGVPETILRLFNPLSTKYWAGQISWTLEPHPCPYRHSTLYMLDSPNEYMKKVFNLTASAMADLIRDTGGRSVAHDALDRLVFLSDYQNPARGTRSNEVRWVTRNSIGKDCTISWVPTGIPGH